MPACDFTPPDPGAEVSQSRRMVNCKTRPGFRCAQSGLRRRFKS
jgi:hypothetical protein